MNIKDIISSPYTWGLLLAVNIFDGILAYGAGDSLFIVLNSFMAGACLIIFARGWYKDE